MDGERGDDDLIADGSIVDLGAPGSTDHPWQNPILPEDVNNDTLVSSLDVLALIQRINTSGIGQLPLMPSGNDSMPPFWDVSGDNQLSPVDVLEAIQYINANPGGEGEPSGEHAFAQGVPTVRETIPAAWHGVPTISISANAGSGGSSLDTAGPFRFEVRPNHEMPHQNAGLNATGYTDREELTRKTRVGTVRSISTEPELGSNFDDDLLSLLAEDVLRGQRR